MNVSYEIRKGAYYDSVVLMQLQRALTQLPDVDDAGCVMATPANLELLTAGGLLPASLPTIYPDDLLIVVQAADQASADFAVSQVDALLKARRSTGADSDFRPRSLEGATKMLPGAEWVLVSVPGRYATGVAEQGLALGKHIFLYSDNVSIEDEVKLKQQASQQGLMVMGADCGTAILNGVGLGFANRVRRGNAGIISASGTGLQAVSSHIHQLGGGVSQAIGTGGRDLSEAVGGITALQSLHLLNRDPATHVILLLSKPPAPSVATKLLNMAQQIEKPVVIYFMGYPPPAKQIGNVHFALNLTDAGNLAMRLTSQQNVHFALNLTDAGNLAMRLTSQQTTKKMPATSNTNSYLRGLYSGGTLAYELVLALQASLTPLFTNTPIHPEQKLADPLHSYKHTIVDMGDDIFTQGRLHPMMDNDLRLRRLAQEADDPETGLIVLDVVLGEGAHPNPAEELAPAIAGTLARRKNLPIYLLIIGTEDDPQGLDAQKEAFSNAGVRLFTTPIELAEQVRGYFAQHTPTDLPPISLEPFQRPLAGINVG